MNQEGIGHKVRPEALILVWAFAESGIGGLLHAAKVPLTGIFVGGIAVICISLLAWYSEGRRQDILKALFMVLSVKLAVSPHSPWQAYVAVLFQGYLGYLIYKNTSNFKIKALIFSSVCLLESAFQKLIIALLVFGIDFFKALDQASMAVAKSFHVEASFSIVSLVFGIYVTAHLIMGVIIGVWIPKMPAQVERNFLIIPDFTSNAYNDPRKKRTRLIVWMIGLSIVLLLLLFIKISLPAQTSSSLIYIFVRSIVVSILLVFLIGPVVVFLIRKILKSSGHHNKLSSVNVIVDFLPEFTDQIFQMFVWINQTYSGLRRIKYYVLGLLIISIRTTDKFKL